jgi:hypothetical protein
MTFLKLMYDEKSNNKKTTTTTKATHLNEYKT